jgi:hypothetical protein
MTKGMFVFALVSLVGSIFRTDHGVLLGVVALWYGIPFFEQFLFYVRLWRRASTCFPQKYPPEKQIDHETYVWNQADYVGLLRFQIDVRFYLPRAEFYRETT